MARKKKKQKKFGTTRRKKNFSKKSVRRAKKTGPRKKAATKKKKTGKIRKIRRGKMKKTAPEKTGEKSGRANLVRDLIFRAKQRGFVTEDEILHVIPNAEQNIEEVEGLYEKLEELGVRVMSSDEMLKLETEKISENLEKEKGGHRKRKEEEKATEA